jgi:hypothetical protein
LLCKNSSITKQENQKEIIQAPHLSNSLWQFDTSDVLKGHTHGFGERSKRFCPSSRYPAGRSRGYAPGRGNDWLLLGLKDSLHEYEIDVLRQRSLAVHREPEPQESLISF